LGQNLDFAKIRMPAEFFYLGDASKVVDEFFLGRFHLGLGPSLHRLSPQQPHFLDNPLFDRVGLLEIFPEVATAMAIDANRSRRLGSTS
jgi:hypothetical protein